MDHQLPLLTTYSFLMHLSRLAPHFLLSLLGQETREEDRKIKRYPPTPPLPSLSSKEGNYTLLGGGEEQGNL